jgi:protein-L-isoaspartate(D-aspartate) O-methyltransferase
MLEAVAAQLRDRMVREQIAGRGITDAAVLDVLRQVPRHRFVSEALANEAYADHPLAIGEDQTISQPYMVALMTALLALRPTDRVLEIGTGSGYQTAVLAALAHSILSIERHPPLAASAAQRLQSLGYNNITIRCADGTRGAEDADPFDAILVTAGGPEVPPLLQQQLAEGGRLVCPIGDRTLQTLVRITRHGNRFETTRTIQCTFVPLVGEYGWPGE